MTSAQPSTSAGRWPIWVVSLPSAQDRRALIARNFAAAGLEFEFFDAIDGRKGLAPEYEAMVDRVRTLERDGTPMTDGEYACALSHQAVYLRIIEEDLPGAIVLEDDAMLTPAFRQFYLERGYEAAPPHPDVLFPGPGLEGSREDNDLGHSSVPTGRAGLHDCRLYDIA